MGKPPSAEGLIELAEKYERQAKLIRDVCGLIYEDPEFLEELHEILSRDRETTKSERMGPLSMYGVEVEDALCCALATPPLGEKSG